MNLTPIKNNMNEIETDRYKILMSYQTAVACYDKRQSMYFRTLKNWSRTTNRHINQWLNEAVVFNQPQEFFDNLLNEVK